MTRVAIIGGIGGLTAASALSQAGSRCFTWGLRRLGTYDQACGGG